MNIVYSLIYKDKNNNISLTARASSRIYRKYALKPISYKYKKYIKLFKY